MRSLFVLCAVFFATSYGQQAGAMCRRYGGPCIAWQQCGPVVNLMRENNPEDVILAFYCGESSHFEFAGTTTYFVCCPNVQGGQQGGQQGGRQGGRQRPPNGGGDDDEDIAPPKRWNEPSSDENEGGGEEEEEENGPQVGLDEEFEEYSKKLAQKPKYEEDIESVSGFNKIFDEYARTKGITKRRTSAAKKRPKKVRKVVDKRKLLPSGDCGIQATDKILGGKETQLEEFPWMALLHLGSRDGRGDFICGGSIISSRYVLTAAHCVVSNDFPDGFTIDMVRLGEHDQNSDPDCQGSKCNLPPQDVPIEKITSHAKYGGSNGLSNDIALLRLRKPIKFNSFVQPICLPFDTLANKNYEGEDMWNAGWGKTTNRRDSASPFKLKVKLPVLPLSQCREVMQEVVGVEVTSNQICAGAVKGKSSCHGDSGGPLMKQDMVGSAIRWYVHGVVSFGSEKCGRNGVPAVYTRVGKYLPWILDNMEP